MVVNDHLWLSRLFDLRKALISILIIYKISKISQCIFQLVKHVGGYISGQTAVTHTLTSNINTSYLSNSLSRILTNITVTLGCTRVLL